MKIIQRERDEYLLDFRMNMGFVIIMFWGKLIYQKFFWEEYGNCLEKMFNELFEWGERFQDVQGR